jgi:hypothetical protein
MVQPPARITPENGDHSPRCGIFLRGKPAQACLIYLQFTEMARRRAYSSGRD